MTKKHQSKTNSESIVKFFRNESPDDSGRMLNEILAWPDGPLEYTHNFIQWLFPMREASPVNPDAPTVDDATVAAFNTDPKLKESLAAAFNRMARFYGFEVLTQGGKVRVVKSSDWAVRSANWLTPRNHNMLRITRIITSLRLLGLKSHARAFFAELRKIYRSEQGDVIGSVTYEYWESAAGG